MTNSGPSLLTRIKRRFFPVVEPLPRCEGCHQTFPLSGLVLVNHCYHTEVGLRHRRCAGLRVLCGACHAATGTFDFYADALRVRRRYQGDTLTQALIGLQRNLDDLNRHAAMGIDVADEEQLRLSWVPSREVA